MHQRDGFTLGKISPPASANRPQTEPDLANSQVSVLVSRELHTANLITEAAEVTEKNWVSVLCMLRVLFSRGQSLDNSSQRLQEEYPLG